MLFLVLLTILVHYICSSPLSDAEAERTLIYHDSPDTFENRKIVKFLLQSLRKRSRRIHLGRGITRERPPEMPDLGPKNNISAPSISEANKDVADWMFQGDILLTPLQASLLVSEQDKEEENQSENGTVRVKRACETNSALYWSPKVYINYTIDSSLATTTASLIRQAVQFWQSNTCLNFRENASGNHRLRFYKGSGCWSYIGKQTWSSQDISIGSGCETMGIVAHEMGHALGFYHTQSRYDRDDWVRVYLNNVASNQQYNFDKMTPARETHFGQAYDYGSVMQYGPYAFAIDYNQYTLTAVKTEYQNAMGQREAPAFSDIRMMNWLYNCSSYCVNTPVPPCRKPGYADPRNCGTCKCPRVFSGQYCQNLPTGTAANCNGAVVQATSTSWATLRGVAGTANSYTTTSTKDCYWHIQAEKTLIYHDSPDTFENRKIVKFLLQSLRKRSRRIHLGRGITRERPPEMPDLGPKNNISAPSISEAKRCCRLDVSRRYLAYSAPGSLTSQ
ncbi:unnamed protein product [Cylicocyclus nassatus]|uniref:Metalloendopeptidase n=1 Tax=Cylicocyclus nassatus TaxID=53992 RepID=A0AA36DMG4_CYLNA|nr:unnamed protein product [Cylicocyclus nassatus]